jgi:hypothetical protein
MTSLAEIIWCFKILFEVIIFWNPNFELFKQVSDGEMTKIKVIDLDDFFNIVVDDFFIWNHSLAQKSVFFEY